MENEWDDFVKELYRGWHWPGQTPEGIMKNYHSTIKRLANVRERLKTPVSLKGGGPLRAATVRQFANEEKDLIERIAAYRKLIKCLVKYNLLPTSNLISGEKRTQFVFTLWTMLELPELGKAVYHANRLMASQNDKYIPSTNEDYEKMAQRSCRTEDRSRESRYDALMDSLNEVMQHLKKERQRYLFGGKSAKPIEDQAEKQIEHNGQTFKVLRGGLYMPRESEQNGRHTEA